MPKGQSQNHYTTNETHLINQLLIEIPRGGGVLPYEDFGKTHAWSQLLTRHTEGSLRAKVRTMWKKMYIPITPKPAPPMVITVPAQAPVIQARAPIQEVPKPKAPVQLNHAFNYCPNCGIDLQKATL